MNDSSHLTRRHNDNTWESIKLNRHDYRTTYNEQHIIREDHHSPIDIAMFHKTSRKLKFNPHNSDDKYQVETKHE